MSTAKQAPKATILIAEDDGFLANAYRFKIENTGYRVLMASDGESALQSMDQERPDLVIMDLVMPNMDGFTVIEKIKAKPEWKKIPIVVTSNLGQDEDVARAMKLGVNDYVIKSDIRLKDLLTIVTRLLQS